MLEYIIFAKIFDTHVAKSLIGGGGGGGGGESSRYVWYEVIICS